MDLQQIFYIVGIIYMSSWLLFLIWILFLVVTIVRQLQQLKKEFERKTASVAAAANTLTHLPWKKIVSILGMLPIVKKVVSWFRENDPEEKA